MQAIRVKFLGPTNNRGSRYKATCDAGSITVSADYSLNYSANHDRAANALIEKLGWKEPDYKGTWNSRELDNDETVYVYSYPTKVNKLETVIMEFETGELDQAKQMVENYRESYYSLLEAGNKVVAAYNGVASSFKMVEF